MASILWGKTSDYLLWTNWAEGNILVPEKISYLASLILGCRCVWMATGQPSTWAPWRVGDEEVITWPIVTVTSFTIKAYFHHDEIGWKSVCRDVVSSCPSSPSSHWGGRPAHNTVPVQLLDSTRNLINLSELKNLAKCVLYANLTDLPPNWRHLRLFLPSSIPPTVSYTSCTPLEFSCVLCKYISMQVY